MSDIKISASVGSLSFAYEGEVSLFADHFATVIGRLSEIARELPSKSVRVSNPVDAAGETDRSLGRSYQGTINTLVAKIGAESCSELLKAAAVHLTFYDGKERFSATEWDTAAKEANVWKASYSNSKAKDKKRSVGSGFIIENAKDIYSLSPSARKSMEEKIGSQD